MNLSTNTIHYRTINPDGTAFVVGDIHGCYDELFLALKAIGFDFTTDTLFSLGDIVDRGTNDLKSMSLQLEPWFKQVLGNHEALHLEDYRIHPSNGTLWSYSVEQNSPELYQQFLTRCSQLPNVIIIDNKYALIHAALPMISYSGLDEITDIKQILHEYEFTTNLYRPDPTLWDISIFHSSYIPPLPGIDQVFHGHYIQPNITVKGKSVYLDTGFMSPEYSNSDINSISFAILNKGRKPIYLTVVIDFAIQRVIDIHEDIIYIN